MSVTTDIRHDEITVRLAAEADRVFAHLDDPARLGEHMTEPSMMMLGGRMAYERDTGGGREVGSHIRMTGSFLGMTLSVDEVITERVPPVRKAWETVGRQRLIVIDSYRMGFDITPEDGACRLRVFIDYRLSGSLAGRLLGRVLASGYARWCIRRMAEDAARLHV